jgi:hypothetical protein
MRNCRLHSAHDAANDDQQLCRFAQVAPLLCADTCEAALIETRFVLFEHMPRQLRRFPGV